VSQIQDKTKIPAGEQTDFALVETILWEDCCGFWLLTEHLQRMKASAAQFSFVYDEVRILAQLDDVVRNLACDSLVRVELHRDGVLNMMAKPASEDRRPVRASPAQKPVDSDNVFLYHSTTRNDYIHELTSGVEGADEVLLWNNREEVIGSATSNLVVELDGLYYTPPSGNGVRPGTCRANLIQQCRLIERPILLEELKNCTKVYLINSQIGWREVILV